jgi:hypothetical protein
MDAPTPLLNPTELYDKRRAKDASKLRAYNTILERIYHRIRSMSRLPQSQAYLLYPIPPFIFGLPKLDMEDCVVYLIYQLRHAQYQVRYTPPNMLYISWAHHESSYLTEQSPIMLSMLESAQRTQSEIERKEKEASRLLVGRKSQRKVKFQDPSAIASPAIPRTAMETVLQGGRGSNGGMGSGGMGGRPPSAGSIPSAGSYVPNPSFLQSMLNPQRR